MSVSSHKDARHCRSKATAFIFDNSLLLLAGTIAAVAWANIGQASYDRFAHPLHFWVNDVGMVFFFALAAKEVYEAALPGGPLATPRRALSPLAAAVGGMVAPAVIYIALASIRGPSNLMRGWAIPCATDIAFSAMVARIIFPAAHPAVPFLLLLAIVDDALGLVILAVFYPSGSLSFAALAVLMSTAIALALWLRRRQTRSFWPYVIGPGSLSWAALYCRFVLWWFSSGTGARADCAVHAACAARPWPVRSAGAIPSEHPRPIRTLVGDARPVLLFLFGFANAGVPFEQIGPGTYYVLAALLLGKPIGILLFTYGARLLGSQLPHGLRLADLIVVAVAASIGFTVSLFFATAAFPNGPALAETKMGDLLSVLAAPLALLVARAGPRRAG